MKMQITLTLEDAQTVLSLLEGLQNASPGSVGPSAGIDIMNKAIAGAKPAPVGIPVYSMDRIPRHIIEGRSRNASEVEP